MNIKVFKTFSSCHNFIKITFILDLAATRIISAKRALNDMVASSAMTKKLFRPQDKPPFKVPKPVNHVMEGERFVCCLCKQSFKYQYSFETHIKHLCKEKMGF